MIYPSVALLFLYQGVATNAFLSPARYDFIIVGGGTAGCLLASHLSEVLDWTVLLLEAGGEENLIQDIPLLAPAFTMLPSNWGYRSQKNETFGLAMREGRIIWPRGKVLGGSSVINAMVYTRGNRLDYDKWEEMGNTNWNYEKVLPYFLKFEKMLIKHLISDTKYHSTNGELTISFSPYCTPLATAFVEAGRENGYRNSDYNGENQIGFSYCQLTMKDGVRLSSYRAFLEPVRTRKNLHIKKNTLVTRILIDSRGRAYGVEYRLFGLLPIQVYAKKEVIISGGTINSPQLLMLSGIGPKEHLDELGISVIQDLKVGYNLQDQVTLLNLYFTVNQSVDIQLSNPVNFAYNFAMYVMKHDGQFTVPSGFEALSFLDLEKADGFPEIELFFGGLLLPSIPLSLSRLGILTDEFNEFYRPLQFQHGFTILPILLRPRSVGNLKLRDRNPYSHPLIYPNYFSDARDMEMLIKGIKLAVLVSKSKPFNTYGATLYGKPLPPCKSHLFESDAYWACAVRYMTMSVQHAVGTCKMGPDSDTNAVVDPELRVRGIKNLRVVDASVIPTIIAGHTMAPVYMIAEKAADMIKEQWKPNSRR